MSPAVAGLIGLIAAPGCAAGSLYLLLRRAHQAEERRQAQETRYYVLTVASKTRALTFGERKELRDLEAKMDGDLVDHTPKTPLYWLWHR